MTPLRQRMLEDMQIRNLSPHTQASYVQQVSQFARHFSKSPAELGPEDIRTYQVYLTNERKLAPEWVLIAVSAIRFLYKITLKKDCAFEEAIPTCKKPQKLPTILSPAEVLQLLACVRTIKQRAILTTCYAAGQRVSEAVHLKPTPGENYQAPQSWAEQAYHKLIYYNKVDEGGHYAAWEQPQLFSEEVRAGFRPLRK